MQRTVDDFPEAGAKFRHSLQKCLNSFVYTAVTLVKHQLCMFLVFFYMESAFTEENCSLFGLLNGDLLLVNSEKNYKHLLQRNYTDVHVLFSPLIMCSLFPFCMSNNKGRGSVMPLNILQLTQTLIPFFQMHP